MAGARWRSRTRARCSFRRRATPSSIWRATTSPCRTARCAAPAAGRTSSCAIRTASTASSSSRSARRGRGRRGSTSWRSAFPSGRTAEEVVPRDAAALVWMANLACLELHPHPVRADDLDHPDELRVDLDPVPGIEWPQIREVAGVVRATLDDFGLVGWPKTSGSRGMHVYVRIERRWTFDEVRRAALALAREVERRAPDLATSKWWKEERHGVFLDYNQNAKDRTVASAYSVRPTADARVSAPLAWDEIDACEPGDFTLAHDAGALRRRSAIATPPSTSTRVRSTRLLELSARQEAEGLGDAPWPPHYRKQPGEAPARHAVTPANAAAPARRDRTRPEEGGRARRSRAVEGAPPGRERASRTGRRARRRDARPLSHVDARPRQPPARAGGAPARAGAARSRRRLADDWSGVSDRDWPRRRPSRAVRSRDGAGRTGAGRSARDAARSQ